MSSRVPDHNHDTRYYRRAEVDYRSRGAYILVQLRGVDGAGSQLDADTVDGVHAAEIGFLFHTHPMIFNTATVIPADTCLALDHVEIGALGSLDVQGVLNL